MNDELRMMNKYIKYLTLLLIIESLASCRKEETLGNVDDIPGLGGDSWSQGPIDKWILDNYTTPFNIEIKYKWDQFALGQLDKNVVPVKESIVTPLLSAIKRVWLDTYIAEVGLSFIKTNVPKFFV